MTDALNSVYDLHTGHNGPAAAPNRLLTPEQRLKDALTLIRETTDQILSWREQAVKQKLQDQAIGSKAGKLWDRFANPFRLSDTDTTQERYQTEARIRQGFAAAESAIGGRIFALDPSVSAENLADSFGIDELGDAVWVHRSSDQNVTVTRYHIGVDEGDFIFKVQSVQDSNGDDSPSSVVRSMIRLSELGRLATALALLRDSLRQSLYGIYETSQPSRQPEATVYSRSLPTDFSRDQLAA